MKNPRHKKKRIFRTIKEFEKTFLPNAYSLNIRKTSDDSTLGTIMARETIAIIREEFDEAMTGAD